MYPRCKNIADTNLKLKLALHLKNRGAEFYHLDCPESRNILCSSLQAVPYQTIQKIGVLLREPSIPEQLEAELI